MGIKQSKPLTKFLNGNNYDKVRGNELKDDELKDDELQVEVIVKPKTVDVSTQTEPPKFLTHPEDADRTDLMASWKVKYRTKSGLTICGSSSAKMATSFWCVELATYFDAGVQGVWNPELILVPHGHLDHSKCINMMNCGHDTSSMIYVPNSITGVVHDYILKTLQMNRSNNVNYDVSKVCQISGVESHKNYEVTLKKRNYNLETFRCYHGIVSIGFGISEVKRKFREENKKLKPQEIKKLSDEEKYYLEHKRLIVFLGDTTFKVFEDENNQSIFQYPVIMVECTYFLDGEEQMALDHRHCHWNHILPYIKKYPDIEFILIHFSTRYRSYEIRDFFQEQRKIHKLNNIVAWIP